MTPDKHLSCHICEVEAEDPMKNCELPTGWGWLMDNDSGSPTGKGLYWACEECKDPFFS